MKVLTKALIRESEEVAVQSGTFSWLSLMENAGKSAAGIIENNYDIKNKKVTVICGKGNNGGDGFVIAETLAQNGAEVSVYLPLGEPTTESAKYFYSKLILSNKVTELPYEQDIIIDALFGIGLDRTLDDSILSIVEELNKAEAVKISVDIPSGVEADSGKILGNAFNADLTITFIALKPCFLLPNGSDYCGEVIVADIGVLPKDYNYLTNEKPVFKKRKHNSHKGTFGTALNICGSYGMAGAAILSARAALRSGVGILKAAVCTGIYSPFTASVPEAVCVPLKQNSKGTIDAAELDIGNLIKGSKAILIGCGLGNNRDTRYITKTVLKTANVPIILDADGINSIADSINIIKKTKAPVILTPHPAEMSRITGNTVMEIEENRVKIATDFAKEYGCVLVLKGANSIIATPTGEITFNTNGNPGMATGGSGDVLSGIIVSLLAQGFSPENAAKAAVYLHGEAGDKAAEKHGERGMLPSDMIEEL